MTTTDTSRAAPPNIVQRPLYDPTTGRFNVRQLQYAIFVRGWTTEEFVLEVACSRTSVYKALAGQPIRDRTARAIIEGLRRRAPRLELLE